MNDDDRTRVQHMLEAGEEIAAFIAGRSRADLEADRMLLFAVVRAIEIPGRGGVARLRRDTGGLAGNSLEPHRRDAQPHRSRLLGHRPRRRLERRQPGGSGARCPSPQPPRGRPPLMALGNTRSPARRTYGRGSERRTSDGWCSSRRPSPIAKLSPRRGDN